MATSPMSMRHILFAVAGLLFTMCTVSVLIAISAGAKHRDDTIRVIIGESRFEIPSAYLQFPVERDGAADGFIKTRALSLRGTLSDFAPAGESGAMGALDDNPDCCASVLIWPTTEGASAVTVRRILQRRFDTAKIEIVQESASDATYLATSSDLSLWPTSTNMLVVDKDLKEFAVCNSIEPPRVNRLCTYFVADADLIIQIRFQYSQINRRRRVRTAIINQLTGFRR